VVAVPPLEDLVKYQTPIAAKITITKMIKSHFKAPPPPPWAGMGACGIPGCGWFKIPP
jgi:hypothetical protein